MSQQQNHERTRSLLLGLAAALALGLAQSASAQQDPIYLDADAAEIDQSTGVSVYTGNVVLTRGERELRGDRMTVHTDDQRNLSRIEVSGSPAEFVRPQSSEGPAVRGQAPRIEYYASGPERILLLDGGTVLRGADRFTGETIRYDVEADVVDARGGGSDGSRVRITLFPEN